jgi:transcriptional repressor NrdR
VAVRCPGCAQLDDKVVDSRTAEDGGAIRRRRECLSCGTRFTTYERLEELPLRVVKRSGDRVPFDRAKIAAGIRAAAKNRPISETQMAAIAAEVEEALQVGGGGDVGSDVIGMAVLDRLRVLDSVAYLRFASVYKDFDDVADFEREVTALAKDTPPKQH